MSEISKKTGFVESFDGTKIYYEVRGTGKPLIMCYGIGCLFNHWRPQVQYFSKNYQVILFDYRAHQKSGLPEDENNYSLDCFAHDIKALMTHLQIDKASFLGHSFGAQVIVKTYDIFPELFESIIFVNGFIENPLKGMFGTDLSHTAFNLIQKAHKALPETVEYLWKLSISNPLAIPISALAGGFNLNLTQYKDIEIYARGIANLNLDAFLKIFEQMVDYDGHPVLPHIKVPSLIIAGDKDNVTPLKHQEQMYKQIPNAEWALMPYGTHCTQLDLPEYVNLRIEKFLNEHLNKPKKTKKTVKKKAAAKKKASKSKTQTTKKQPAN